MIRNSLIGILAIVFTTGVAGVQAKGLAGFSSAWEIVWAAQTLNGLMHISAQQDENGHIVMDVLKPAPPQPRRITFFPPTESGWDWAMEWSFDAGETWTEVYRITATPYEDN